MATEKPEPAWSARFTADDWAYLDSIVLPTITDDDWAGKGFNGRDSESTT